MMHRLVNAMSRNAYKQGKLRSECIDTYNKCVISKMSSSHCDAAHIIPLNVCNDNSISYYIYNALLLDRPIHKEFDQYHFTFDVFNYQLISDNDIQLNIIINPFEKKELEVKKYKYNLVILPYKTLYFLIHHFFSFFKKVIDKNEIISNFVKINYNKKINKFLDEFIKNISKIHKIYGNFYYDMNNDILMTDQPQCYEDLRTHILEIF